MNAETFWDISLQNETEYQYLVLLSSHSYLSICVVCSLQSEGKEHIQPQAAHYVVPIDFFLNFELFLHILSNALIKKNLMFKLQSKQFLFQLKATAYILT